MCRTSSVCSSIMMSMTSSTVTIPSRRFSSSTTGIAWTSYFETRRATSSWGVSAFTVSRRRSIISEIFFSGGAGKRCRSDTYPTRWPRVVERVEALDRFDLRVDALQVVERLGHRPLGTDRRELLGHETAGRAGRMAQQPLDFGRVAGRHPGDDAFALALRQVLEQERDFVGGQPIELGAELGRGGAVQDQAQRLALQLREHGGALLGRQRLEEHDAVFARQIVQQLRQVRRVDVRHRRGQLLRIFPDQLLDVRADHLGEGHGGGILSLDRRRRKEETAKCRRRGRAAYGQVAKAFVSWIGAKAVPWSFR